MSSVGRSIKASAQYINVIKIRWVDADLAVIHGARIQAVDSLPCISTVGRLKDPTKLKPIFSLLVLKVLILTSEAAIERVASATSTSSRSRGRPFTKGDFEVDDFTFARDLQFAALPRFKSADVRKQVAVGGDRLVLNLNHDVTRLDPRFERGALVDHVGDSRSDLNVFAIDAHEGRVFRNLSRLLCLNDGVNVVGVTLRPT